MTKISLDLDLGIEVDAAVLILFWYIVRSCLLCTLDAYPNDEALLTLYGNMHSICWLLKLSLSLKACGIHIVLSRPDTYYELKRGGVKRTLEKFCERTKLKFVGISDIKNNDFSGVLHPVDFFIKHFYDRFFPTEVAEAFSTYKRTNPTLGLKLEYLEKYAEPHPCSFEISELHCALDEVKAEILSCGGFPALVENVRRSVIEKKFYELSVDQSSAAGFPYAQGVKRKTEMDDAVRHADVMLESEGHFNDYANDHCWYVTGRAKLQTVDKQDAGRLISYSGFAFMLIGMLLVQPWSKFMNTFFPWCGVGWSWMHGGAEKFARMFGAEEGVAPEGYRYVTVDIKEWDSCLNRDLMVMLIEFYSWLMFKCNIGEGYAHRFIVILNDMIDAKILMPAGFLFQVFQGMKSGWCNTANDNTLIHKIVFNCIIKRLGCSIKHILYGDDNFMLVPDHITDDMLVNEYARFGLIVGVIHSSKRLCDVDFLAKKVCYKGGKYFIFRDSVESHARILMPEEMDPMFRNRPDSLLAAERCIGHLLDNPFNGNVRHVCYALLHKLKKHYQIERILITDDMKKRHPWRQFETLPTVIPIIPSVAFIEELYGVEVEPLGRLWPSVPSHMCADPVNRSNDSLMYDQALSMVISTSRYLNSLSRKRRKDIVRAASPFAVPRTTYGTHAARLEFAIKYFGLKFRNSLDLGAHPGACAHSLLKVCDRVVCVSLPREGEDFCPYVFRDEAVELIKGDANKYQPSQVFDFIHDDVDVAGKVGLRDEMFKAVEALARASRLCDYAQAYMFTLRSTAPVVIEDMYSTYVKYGHFDIVKPVYSNPWKCEYIVLFRKRRTGHLMRKNVFIQMMNYFLNHQAPTLIRWAEFLLQYAREDCREVNPLRHDEEYQRSLDRWLLTPNIILNGNRSYESDHSVLKDSVGLRHMVAKPG